nr:hypothetical protein [Tanacetum cinerariifolium]
MNTTIEQQAAMDEALVPHAQRLKIGMSNFRLLLNIKSKESTLQLVYDVLRICPFFKEILTFIYFLGHSAPIRTLTAVNINKLYQPWRSFATIINKFLTRKSSSYDSLRLSQAQILWGLYHKRNIDYAYLLWEDFVYQVKHKNTKKSNEMYYPRFTKVIIHHFMSKDLSILRRNKVNWHYVRDDHIFSTIKLVSRHQNTQLFGALLPIELTNKEIRNSNAYKEYYAIATRAAPPKPKASVIRTRSSSDTSITPPTAATSPRLTASAKGKQIAKAMQQTHISQASGFVIDERTGSIPGVSDAPTDESEEELSWNSTDDKGADDEGKDGDDDEEDEGDDGEEGDGDDDDDEDDDGDEDDDDDADQEVVRDDDKNDEEEGGNDEHELNEDKSDKETRDEESFDPIPQTPENSKDKGNGAEDLGLNQSSSVSSQFVTSMLNPTLDVGLESIFETTSQMDVQTPTSVAPLSITAPTMTPSTIATITTSQAPILPTTVPSNIIQNLPNFGLLFHFDDRLRSLEANFFEAMQTNQFTRAVSAILGIVNQYMDQRINEAVKVAIQIQSNRLRDEAQRENKEFLKTVDENMQKIIKEQVKEQVKILIKKIEGNKSIQHSDEQRNLYKALVEAYESDKIILDTYRETVTLKRRRDDDADKDEEPSAGPDRGSKRRREGKEPESRSLCRLPLRWKSPHIQSLTQVLKINQFYNPLSILNGFLNNTNHNLWKHSTVDKRPRDLAVYRSIQPWISDLAKKADTRSSFNELMDTPLDFSNFLINQLKVDRLTPELLAGPTYELMKGSCKSLVELEYHLEEVFKATTYQLDWVNPEGQQYPHNLLQPLPLIPNNLGRHVILFEHFINNDLEYLRGGASSSKYTTSITKTKAVDYGHIKWIEDLITVQTDDDKLYKFKEGDFKRLRIQDIKDILLLLVQGKLTNLTVEERFAFNVSLRMFTRSIVIQRRVEDLQLGVKSYQKKLNLTKPDSYRSDLKRKEAYTAYSNPRGFTYQNKDKRNRLMRIDELHKFSDGMLIDVRTALDNRLKGIRMQYLPQLIWRKSDKDRATVMIQAIDKRLKRRIMRSLERFIGGRLYEGDIRILQRTI